MKWNWTELNSNIGCTSHLAANPLNSSRLDSTQINSFVSSQQQLATKKYYLSGMWDKSTEGFVVSYGTMLFIRERILGTWVPGSKRDSLELDILNSLHLVFVSCVYWQIFKSVKEMTHSIQFRMHGMCRHAQRKAFSPLYFINTGKLRRALWHWLWNSQYNLSIPGTTNASNSTLQSLTMIDTWTFTRYVTTTLLTDIWFKLNLFMCVYVYLCAGRCCQWFNFLAEYYRNGVIWCFTQFSLTNSYVKLVKEMHYIRPGNADFELGRSEHIAIL